MFVCHSPCAASWFHARKTSCRQAMRFAFGGRRRWGRWLALWCLAWTQCNSDVQNMAETFGFRASHLCDAIHFGHLDQSLRELRRVVVSHGSCESQCVAARSRRGVVSDCRACHTVPMVSSDPLPWKLERQALGSDAGRLGAVMRSRIGSSAFALIASYAPASLIRALIPVEKAEASPT